MAIEDARSSFDEAVGELTGLLQERNNAQD